MEPEFQQPEEEARHGTLTAFFTALRFLTVIPVSWRADRDDRLFPYSIYYFAAVGLLIGCLGLLLCQVTALLFPPSVIAFLTVFYLSAISGFLHLDGLADSADGLLSARPREQSLAIMKDSRSGPMGVVIMISVLLGKYAALSAMSQGMLSTAVLCMPLAGRSAIVVTMGFLRYARPEGGLGGLFYSAGTRYAAVLSCTVLLTVALVSGGPLPTIAIFLALAVTVYWFGVFCRARLGGATGDTLGAVCELTEMSVAIALTAML